MRFPWRMPTRRVRHKPLVQPPFLGRDVVLQGLAEHLQTAQQGSVQFVSIVGEAGCGKTALLEEFIFLSCSKPHVLLVPINAATCLLAHEYYRQLCVTLQQRAEHILQTAYNATKRLRKTLALSWDEGEFQHMLASAEWLQHPTTPGPVRGRAGRSATPLGQLLDSVQEHPWALSAAVMLGRRASQAPGGSSQHLWQQRWLTYLQALESRYQPGETILVVLLDQLVTPRFDTPRQEPPEQPDWPAFTTTLTTVQLPVLLVWSGTPASVAPLQQAMQDSSSYAQYLIEPLDHALQAQLVRHTSRALAKARQAPWQEAVARAGEAALSPTWLLLATCNAAAGQADLATLATADTNALVQRLVEHIGKHTAATASLWRQLLEACAFMPPNAQFTVDDLLPRCDFATLGVEVAPGRVQLETLLSQCVRYGLLHYEPYAARYTLGDSAVQEALQRVVHPETAVRRPLARQRLLADAILRHVQQGEREGLADVARLGFAEYGEALGDLLAPTVLEPFRRLLPMSTRDERQRMAYALGGFPAGLAVDMLRLLLQDEDGQVRSSTVQSLADLAIAATLPGLLDALDDRNSDVRWIATQALGRMSGTRVVDALIPMLTDEDKEVGRIAAQGLGQQGDSRAVSHLIAATRDSYPLLRQSAISALGELADQRALPAIQAVLQDTNQQVRRSAERALARFTASAGG